MLNQPQQKYHSLLILLHWVMAFAFAVMFVSSEVMEESPNDLAFILHSSLGLSLLLLFIFRFCISIFSRKTINHTQFAKWEQLAFQDYQTRVLCVDVFNSFNRLVDDAF